jgi:uncharacterized ion transporter superfamily protein YfcC
MKNERRADRLRFILPPSSFLLGFFVRPVATAAAAELPKLKPLRRRLLVLRRYVVAALALGALQHNVVARHKFTPNNLITE